MASLAESVAVSDSGEYLAHSSSDGRLKLWDTSTGRLKQEYTPSAHLSAKCTCLSWGPTRQQAFTGGHTATVNGVSWHASSDSLFSVSDDQHIVHWSVSSCKVKSKWKADRHSVYAVAAVDANTVLTASSSIKWWNIDTKSIVMAPRERSRFELVGQLRALRGSGTHQRFTFVRKQQARGNFLVRLQAPWLSRAEVWPLFGTRGEACGLLTLDDDVLWDCSSNDGSSNSEDDSSDDE
ncbi:hypothetical protein HPB51_002019 [Rhipicephalus microplus]|uniref:Uncharacterized protein n=1 Tax=Rhipicephalus microplus TaxID=6941 RepID=A0A9J6DYU7_RHIMP|nr:hypothetical protein HPB51_002019 [Rhipicephalus microplus]